MTEKEEIRKIKETCDQEFLDKLCEVAKVCGWSVDYGAVKEFIEYLHDVAELDRTYLDLEPYEYEE